MKNESAIDDIRTAEEYLKDCEIEVNRKNFDSAVTLFRKALTAKGDQACFFFGNIVRLLIKEGQLSFQIKELYTDLGITDKARNSLMSLKDPEIIRGFRMYCERQINTNPAGTLQ